MGLLFQVPVAILGATRAGLVSPRQLRHGRRYAIVACAAVAAFLPGDAITLLLETVPLYVLYEASILLASLAERRELRRRRHNPEAGSSSQGGGPVQQQGTEEPSVQQIIDHFDRELS